MRVRRPSGGRAGRPQRVRLRLCQRWWVVRVGVWRWTLPRRLRRQSLPAFMHRLTPAPARTPRRGALEWVVRVVRRVCRVWRYRGPRSPQRCLRQPWRPMTP
jgi:hypothetical protein